MRWIRIWTEETLHGSTFKELNASERGIWFSLLPLAGSGPPPDGVIKVSDEWGYSHKQLASLLHVDIKVLEASLKKLISVGKITISGNDIIKINNWKNYQTEYARQKKYRGLKKEVTTKGYKDKLQTEEEEEEEEEGKKKKDNKISTLAKFISAKDEILAHAKELYPDKDNDTAITDFIEGCEIKGYKYKKFDLAFYRWVREDRFNQYSQTITDEEMYYDDRGIPTTKAVQNQTGAW